MKFKDMDCRYCIENADTKVKLPFYCKLLNHYVSKKSVVNATSAFISTNCQ